jgi:hypothetical protein
MNYKKEKNGLLFKITNLFFQDEKKTSMKRKQKHIF